MPSRSGPQREPRSPAPPPRGVLDGGAWGVGRIPGIQIAGPTISLALARLFQIGRDSLQVDTAAGETLATMTTWLARINWILAVFNCVPGTSSTVGPTARAGSRRASWQQCPQPTGRGSGSTR